MRSGYSRIAEFRITSFMPPGLVVLDGKKYICPGWHEVPMMMTLEDVYKHWTKARPYVEEEQLYKPVKEKVLSSKGDKTYTVQYNNGMWDCTCP